MKTKPWIKKTLTESRVVIEPGRYVLWGETTPEQIAKSLTRWADEIKAFFRDHRHQDVNDVIVDHTFKDGCEACGREYEEWNFADDGQPSQLGCAYCGKLQKEYVMNEVANE